MKNEVHQTRVEWRSNSDSQSDVIGLVTRQVLSAVDTNEADSWIIDSGATCHICNDRQSFVNFHPLRKPQDVTLGDGHALGAIETGDVILELLLGNGESRRCKLHNVLYIPKLA